MSEENVVLSPTEQLLEALRSGDSSLKEMEQQKSDSLDTYDLGISAENAAAAINCHVVRPEPNQLQLDIDSEEAYEIYQKRIFEYGTHSKLSLDVECHTSKGGFPNKHITITVNDLDGNPHIFGEWERLALQFALGSDPIRETLNSWRLLTGNDNPSRLFEPNA